MVAFIACGTIVASPAFAQNAQKLREPTVTPLHGSSAGRDHGCLTRMHPEDIDVARFLHRIGAYHLAVPLPRFIPQIPLTIHVVRETDGTGADLSMAEIDETIADANERMAQLGMIVFQRGATRFIDDSGFLHIDNEFEMDLLRLTDNIANTINIYFVDEITLFFGDVSCAVSTFSFQPTQGIVFKKSCTAQGGNDHTFAHEIGHYFDLHHTHATYFGEECPDGSNCESAGDQVCDTPADPNCDEIVDRTSCEYEGTEERCGDPFQPDTHNQMAYVGRCADFFTPQQKSRALATLLNIRPSLFDLGNPTVVWVDFGYAGLSDGSYGRPWPTLDAARDHVSMGGRVVMRPGNSGETLVLSDELILDSFRGSAVIGH
ncbi:MAG: M43 family zinc metalloprotease [Phycisphaerae bacterium]